MVMKRYPHGAAGAFFFMKRAPTPRPDWIEICSIDHGSGNVIDFPMIQDRAALLWVINLGCIDLNQWYATLRRRRPARLSAFRSRSRRRARRSIRCAKRVSIVREALDASEDAVAREDDRIERLARLRPDRPRARCRSRCGRLPRRWRSELAARHPDADDGRVPRREAAARARAGRLQPERLGPDAGVDLFGPARGRTRPFRRRSPGRKSRRGIRIEDFTVKNVPARVAKLGDLWKPLARRARAVRSRDSISDGMLVQRLRFRSSPRSDRAGTGCRAGSSRGCCCLDRATGRLVHRPISDLPVLLQPGDLLVVNNTRVFPARLFGRRVPSGGASSVCCIRSGARTSARRIGRRWCIPGRSSSPGSRDLRGRRVASRRDSGAAAFFGRRTCRCGRDDGSPVEDADRRDRPCPAAAVHQARRSSQPIATGTRRSSRSSAGRLRRRPPASTSRRALLAGARGRAASHRVDITLHVGYGTFQPVRVDRVEDHRLEPERYEIWRGAAQAINRAHRRSAGA